VILALIVKRPDILDYKVLSINKHIHIHTKYFLFLPY
jgi:hypothetical protein